MWAELAEASADRLCGSGCLLQLSLEWFPLLPKPNESLRAWTRWGLVLWREALANSNEEVQSLRRLIMNILGANENRKQISELPGCSSGL